LKLLQLRKRYLGWETGHQKLLLLLLLLLQCRGATSAATPCACSLVHRWARRASWLPARRRGAGAA
jgi:hypothetical protein